MKRVWAYFSTPKKWGRDKIAEWSFLKLKWNLIELYFLWSIWQYVSLGLDNGLAPNQLTEAYTFVICSRWVKSVVAGKHYSDVIMAAIASQITNLTIVYSTAYSDADERKHQSSASLAFTGVTGRVTGHLCGEFTGPRWIPRTNGQ